jgi:Fe2+ transport system protein FeoA
MQSQIPASRQLCLRLKQMGYSQSKSVKLYGEEFEVLSDPYSEDEHIVIQVKSQRTSLRKTVRLPRFVVDASRAA